MKRVIRRLREVSTEGELSAAQASVLARIGKGEAANAARLAEVEGVRPQSMATTIASLEDLGLIERMSDPDDGRRRIVALTDAGRDAEAGNRVARHGWLSEVIEERCTDDECRTLRDAAALLERLASRP